MRDIGHNGYAVRGNRGKETKHQRENNKIRKSHANVEEKDAGEKQWHRESALLLIEARRNKCPHFIKNEWHAGKNCNNECEFERCQERRCDLRRDHCGFVTKMSEQRLCDQCKQVIGKKSQAEKQQEYYGNNTEQAVSQFNQVGKQCPRLGVLYYSVILIHGAALMRYLFHARWIRDRVYVFRLSLVGALRLPSAPVQR